MDRPNDVTAITKGTAPIQAGLSVDLPRRDYSKSSSGFCVFELKLN